MRASSTLKLSLVSLLVLTACGDSKSTEPTVVLKPTIIISSTTDPTSELIAEIYGQALEKAEFRIARKKAFATSGELLAAMAAGKVQLAGMTTQSVLALLASSSPSSTVATTPPTTPSSTPASTPSSTPVANPNSTTQQTAEIVKGLPENLEIGTPTTAEDKDVVFCAKTFTDTNSIVTLTDLGTKSSTATLAAPDGFDAAAPLGAAGLKSLYNIEFKAVVPTEAAKTIEAVTGGTADCGVGRSADPALAAATVTVLEDDKVLVPNDVILPLFTKDIGTDDVVTAIDAISARLTPDSLRAMMGRLKVDGASPEIVANEFTGNAGT
ncbi:MAG TPA: glycine betaine ABC transporter substrate-binding protein [Ilumatobacteraceae bacterium]|nr:glycine betaine ABC transporter substrate-binding protein [Ilumatobacteraceae bacterium]